MAIVNMEKREPKFKPGQLVRMNSPRLSIFFNGREGAKSIKKGTIGLILSPVQNGLGEFSYCYEVLFGDKTYVVHQGWIDEYV